MLEFTVGEADWARALLAVENLRLARRRWDRTARGTELVGQSVVTNAHGCYLSRETGKACT